jgi:hypothetical protein
VKRRRPLHKCKPFASSTPPRPAVFLPADLYARIALWAEQSGVTNKNALERALEGL